MNNITNLESRLSHPNKTERLTALRNLMRLHHDNPSTLPPKTTYVNNHIHTVYSFSPYTPASAAYTAWKSGLSTAGIMDHDTIAGAHEFIESGKIIGIATTIGFECRCKMDSTPFNGRYINSPDQHSVAYMAAHGIPHQNIEKAQNWLAPYREARGLRNHQMVDNINNLTVKLGVILDYDNNVLPISYAHENGSVTERHILYALAEKITSKTGRGLPALDFLSRLGLNITGKTRDQLLQSNDDMYEYYLLGALKSDFVEMFYIPPTDECPNVLDFVTFMREIDGISAYPYLGDVEDSVTGDKKTQTFEDSYLDELVDWLAKAGFNAVTYMPARNTPEQLTRLMKLCEQHSLFQISGEDINTPFQSFICSALDLPQYKHLVDSTWALIGHELAATKDIRDAMFSPETKAKAPNLAQRIDVYKNIGTL